MDGFSWAPPPVTSDTSPNAFLFHEDNTTFSHVRDQDLRPMPAPENRQLLQTPSQSTQTPIIDLTQRVLTQQTNQQPGASQQPIPRQVWCSTTGCLSRGTELNKCRRCKFMLRNHTEFKTVVYPDGSLGQVVNEWHDEDNEEAAAMNQMMAEQQFLSFKQRSAQTRMHHTLQMQQQRQAMPQMTGTTSAALSGGQLQQGDQQQELSRMQQSHIHRQGQSQQLDARPLFIRCYEQAQCVEAYVAKYGWADAGEMWIDGVEPPLPGAMIGPIIA